MFANRDRMQERILGGLLVMVSLGGCGSYGGGPLEGRQRITIDSDPAGASVFAEGVEIGKTPLAIRPGDVFNARFTTGNPDEGIISFRYVGTLRLERAGCEPYNTQVNDNILSKDIHVRLECDPDYQPAGVVTPAVPVPAATPQQAPSAAPHESVPVQPGGSAEERLLRIESLYRKGLLSDEEYRALRQRVLDTL